MHVYKNARFAKFARKEGISDAKLCEAVRNAQRGLIDADLGGGVIKQRIARANKGKSSGYRAIIFFRSGQRSMFVYGFPKSAQENINASEARDFKALADAFWTASEEQVAELVLAGKLWKVDCDGEDKGLQERGQRGDSRNGDGLS